MAQATLDMFLEQFAKDVAAVRASGIPVHEFPRWAEGWWAGVTVPVALTGPAVCMDLVLIRDDAGTICKGIVVAVLGEGDPIPTYHVQVKSGDVYTRAHDVTYQWEA